MKKTLITLLLAAASLAAQNLTPAQKDADFRYLASLYSVYYAPSDWKKTLFNVDTANLKPWLDRVAKTQTDLDFYEVCSDYVSSLNDTHDTYFTPSDFNARLGFGVDIYDGKLLIDTLDRTLLPTRTYPFTTGDELVSIDGVDAMEVLKSLLHYVPQGNDKAARRQTAARLTNRAQSRFPHVVDLGDSAVVIIKRQNGNSETYTIPWTKTGTPLTVGPVKGFKTTTRAKQSLALSDAEPEYTKPLRELQYSGVSGEEIEGVNGYGSRSPIFINGLPSTFTRRLGSASADFFYSGTFKRDELTLGYIRIPNFAPPSIPVALQQLDREIAFMNANTDGLIIDVMRNTGGNLCFGENVAQRLINYEFQATGFQTKPFWARVIGFYNSTINAKAANASTEVIQHYEMLYNELLAANRENRLTVSVPLCSSSLTVQPVKDANGGVTAYAKPIMVLTDEFSTSTADSFSAMMQESRRALLFGYRTNGAGGNNTTFDTGIYTEATTGLTLALQVRKTMVAVPGYPSTNLVENVGVHPDFVDDYMTTDNLLKNGAPFIADFLEAMAAYTREHR